MAAIVLQGLATNDVLPGVYTEIDFAQGPAAGSGSPRTALLIGNFLPAGTAAASTLYGPDTPVTCQTETDVINLFGSGSELHRMWLRFTAVNQVTSLYLITVAQSAGNQASANITLLTVPTGNGNWRIWVGDQFVDTAFASGATLASITAQAVININGQLRWPVSAAQATVTTSNDSVAITAKQKGLRGNWIHIQALITAGIAITTTVTTDTFLTGGTTADSNTAALAVINPKKYYYIVSSAEDSTQFGALVSQVASQAAPTVGIRQRAFAGSVDTISNVNTIAIAQNQARAEIEWQPQSDWTPAELAANDAAIYSLLENSGPIPRNNYSGFPASQTDANIWKVPANRSQTAPSHSDLESALANGVTPIGTNTFGKTYLVKRITTRSLNGAVNDYRIRDAHKVTICDFFGDDLSAKVALQFGGKDLANDPVQGQPPPGPQVVTPRLLRNAIFGLVDVYGNNNLLQNVPAIKAGIIAQRELAPTTRMSALVPLQPVDIADQFALLLQQVA